MGPGLSTYLNAFRFGAAMIVLVSHFAYPRFSDEYLWNALVGILVCCHLVGMASILRHANLDRLSRPLAWLAGGSFSIYLMHYPLLHILHAALPDISHWALFALTVLACLPFAEVFERPLYLWRRALQSLANPQRKRVAG